ncbi:hypothetical protein ARZXY2_2647 [Arthrobacter sp. ZXY-2]|nr:hypothetical protein ARZXY2_2647 [Arthrobacter sp. ZXY-2]
MGAVRQRRQHRIMRTLPLRLRSRHQDSFVSVLRVIPTRSGTRLTRERA